MCFILLPISLLFFSHFPLILASWPMDSMDLFIFSRFIFGAGQAWIKYRSNKGFFFYSWRIMWKYFTSWRSSSLQFYEYLLGFGLCKLFSTFMVRCIERKPHATLRCRRRVVFALEIMTRIMNRLASPYLYHTSLYFLLFLFLYLHTLIQSPSFIPSSNFSFFRPSSSKFSNLPLSIPHSP